MVGNGTSPTSATASLSGASQNSLNSESGISSGTGGGCGAGGRGSPRLKMVETLLAAGKRETAIDMIVPNTQQQPQPQAASGMSESSDTTAPIGKYVKLLVQNFTTRWQLPKSQLISYLLHAVWSSKEQMQIPSTGCSLKFGCLNTHISYL